MALLSRFFGRTASEGAAFAFGLATGPVLRPATETIAQEAWMHYQSRALGAGDVAGIVAEDVELQAWGESEASRTGINKERFDALLGEALNAPGLNELYALWRRGEISDGDFAHGLRKAKLEPRWDAPLRALHDVLLTPDILANARQQGFVDQARQYSESALQGVTNDRAEIMFELSGNPPGPETMMRAVNRGLTDQATFTQAIREGRTKTKYTELLYALRENVLSAAVYVRAHLKGHIDAAGMHAGGAKWGYTAADMDLWYEASGNPASAHQIHIGYARGASVPGAADEQDAIRKSVAQGNLRPEYADVIYAGRYTYPSAFVLRALVTAGTLTEAEGEQVLLFSGWEPKLAKQVAASWAGSSGGTTADAHLSKAQTQLWSRTHSSYIAREISDTVARNALADAGVPAASQAGILSVWQVERDLIRKQLTPAQIKKALAKGSRNAATGQTWTRDEAIAALVALGYAPQVANDYLDIP